MDRARDLGHDGNIGARLRSRRSLTYPTRRIFTMFDNADMLDLVERTLTEYPYCEVCSAPTTIADDHGRLWLVCSATPPQIGILARMSAAVQPHERRLVADLADHRAA
jgi:hypothetical protein